MKNPKIAIATEFLEQYGGAQKVLEAICEIYQDAPIYTAKFNKKVLKTAVALQNRNIIYPKSNFLNTLAKHFFVFAMAPIFENYDFSEYDIIISDGTTWTKGIITKPNQLHISYIHTPPRFFYGYSREGTKWDNKFLKIPFSYLINILRLWDYVAAQRPDFLLSNSLEVQKRIQKFYNRSSSVIYPPVDLKVEYENIEVPFNDYYLAIGRLSKYKNFDQIIKVFNQTKFNLVIVGTGLEEDSLKEIANDNIFFTGSISDQQKFYLIANCKGLINAVHDEDFGIVPVEAHSQGKPVLAHNSGGHKETIKEDLNGMFFENLTKEVLFKFNENISNKLYIKDNIIKESQKYSKSRFKSELKHFIDEKWSNLNKIYA